MRIMHETVIHRASWFVTMTYAPEELPEFGSLKPADLAGFFARYREKLRRRGQELRYYACGEYGEATDRPHYHAVMFGPRFLDREEVTRRSGEPVYSSKSLEDAWGLGMIEFTGVNYPAAAYVAGYVRKKVRQKESPEHYDRVDPHTGEIVVLHPEFARMSRRPAIALRWIEKYWTDVYPRDFVVMNGVERKPPRFYDKWMEENQPEIMMNVREQRIESVDEVGSDVLAKREINHTARVGLFSGRDAV